MADTVLPKVYLIGNTTLDRVALQNYLRDTDQMGFDSNGDDFQVLTSFFAKLCYKSLVPGKNDNLSSIRDTYKNVVGTYESGHGSVFEHFVLNFVFTDVSRIFTHELVRHRVGTAFSQTSGRFVRSDNINIVLPESLNGFREEILSYVSAGEALAKRMADALITDGMPMAEKKKRTSDIRRIAPNGQANEIGVSFNIRAVRHVIHMRTSQHAEWEVRYVFNQVADIISARCPLMLYGFKVSTVDGLLEWEDTLL